MIVGLSESDVMTLRQMAAEFRARNPQVGTFSPSRQPTVLSGVQVKIGKAKADIAAGATGTIEIWRSVGGAAPTDASEEVDAVFDWLSTETITAGKQVMIQRFKDEGLWRIVGAECETTTAAAALVHGASGNHKSN